MTADDWKRALMKVAEGRGGRKLTTAAVENGVGTGRSVRTGPKLFGMPTTAWVV